MNALNLKWRIEMKKLIIGFVVGVVLATTVVSIADVAGMNHRELRRDRDFKKAVKYIVENNCSVMDEQIFC